MRLETRKPRFYPKVKRCTETVLAAAGLLLLAPLMAMVAVAIRLTMGSPVLFRQARPGRFEKPFILYKFRTMRDACDETGRPLRDGERLHPIGTFLRRASLDELPELWNVVRGDMSLIGPRPLLMRYLPFYTEEERTRFQVRPGITGWAQVNGRNYARWDDRLRNDVWYVRHFGFGLDCRILLKTMVQVFGQKDIAVDANCAIPDLDDYRTAAK